MNPNRRHCVFATLGAAVLPSHSFAQSGALGTRPSALVVPFATGGSADLIARFLAKPLSERLGQAVVVENRAGAGGNIGAAAVAKSAADGHTLLLVTNNIYAINPALYGKVAIDNLAQLQPVILIAESPLVIAVPASSPVKNFRDFVQLARSKPGGVGYGTPGIGTDHHLFGELIAQRIGVPLNHIPYKGSGAALGDLGGGQLDALITLISTLQPLVDAGKARIIAVGSREAFPALPGVEPVSRTFDGLEMTVCYGLMTAAGTAPALVAQWNKWANEAMHDATVVTRMKEQSLLALGGGPEVFAARMLRERRQREGVIAAAQVRLN